MNSVIAANGVSNMNFKGFMANNAHANWIAVKKIYGEGDPTLPMSERYMVKAMEWSHDSCECTTTLFLAICFVYEYPWYMKFTIICVMFVGYDYE